MTHYILVKFAPGTDIDAVEAKIRWTYETLAETMEHLKNPVVRRSCVERDTNADLMISIELDGEEHLKPYLTHPLHLQMAEVMDPHVIKRISFDHK